jgi:DNA-directed RNA polymerase subunit RPC12/RpoP
MHPVKTEPTKTAAAKEREAISCPGCGRHDWVQWPQGQATYAWKCFNCGKQFELTRKRPH